jgi:N-acetylneuraminate synthase
MTNYIKIGNKAIGAGRPVFVIAEAGVNHNSKLDLALKLVDAAKDAGADAVKFQTFKAEQVVVKSGSMAEYQKRNLGKTESQLAMLKKLELKEEWYGRVMGYCKKKGIIFLSTPHGGFESVDFLQSVKVPAFKFGSGDLTNLPLLELAAKFRKPMIISTGMATMKESQDAIQCIKKTGNNKIIVLHCTTNYPCPVEEVNLRAMQTMMKKFDFPIGYSDHTMGIQASVMAVTLGARMIEKHFTLDRTMPGPDHVASLEPQELKEMITQIRNCEKILGSPLKKPNSSEQSMIQMVRKSVVTLRTIKKGEKFSSENLGIKRPGTGLAPKLYNKLLGKTAPRSFAEDQLLTKKDYANS